MGRERRVRAGARDKHRQPWKDPEGGGCRECDGDVGDVEGHHQWRQDQGLGTAEQWVRQENPVPARGHVQRPKPDHHRPELLPQQRELSWSGAHI